MQRSAEATFRPDTRARWLAAAQLVAIVTLLGLVAVGGDAAKPWLPRCAFHETTGLHCPGCGATRATRQLFHGQLRDALRYNPFFILIGLPFGVFYAASLVKTIAVGRPIAVRLNWPIAVWTLTVVIIAFGILRNLPFEVFDILRPPE